MRCGNKDCKCQLFHEETVNDVKNEMLTDNQYLDIANLFKIISDPTRIKIIEAIKTESLCVFDIAHLLGVTKSAISHQMKLLKEYNVVTSNREGKMVYYKLDNDKVLNIINQAKGYLGENYA